MNSMYFSKEDVEAGLMSQLIDYLCKYSYESGPSGLALYNDIHIKPGDCGAFVVEWEQAPWSGDYGGRFEFVDEEQAVCNEVIYPDGTFIYSPHSQEDEIKYWLEDHPGWHKDIYGVWHYSEQEKPEDKLKSLLLEDKDNMFRDPIDGESLEDLKKENESNI